MNAASLSEVLECAVCLEQLSDNHKCLPCQHTFCLECLLKLNEHLCPECRCPFPQDIYSLPQNLLLNRMLGALWKIESSKPHPGSPVATDININDANKYYIVKESYKAIHAKEISLIKNAIVVLDNQQPVNSDWKMGEFRGEKGFFPANRVTFTDCAIGEALESSTPEYQNCLGFQKGDCLVIKSIINRNWVCASLIDVIGNAPLRFLKLNARAQQLVKQKRFSNRKCPSERKRYSLNNLPSRPLARSEIEAAFNPNYQPDPPEIYIAEHAYKACRYDEIELIVGNRYMVLKQCPDKWYFGRPEKQSGFTFGYFPGTHVRKITEESKPDAVNALSRPFKYDNLSGAHPLAFRESSPVEFRQGTILLTPEKLPSENSNRDFALFKVKADLARLRIDETMSASSENVDTSGPEVLANIYPRNLKQTPRRSPQSNFLSFLKSAMRTSRNEHKVLKCEDFPSTASSSSTTKLYRAIESFPSMSSEELSLSVNDRVILEEDYGNGWWYCTLQRNGHRGLVPMSFLERC